MWTYPVGTETDPTIISHWANLGPLIVIQLFPAQVPFKELAPGERPHIALQITCTSPSLIKHNFQLQMEDEYLHLMTDFLTIRSPEALRFTFKSVHKHQRSFQNSCIWKTSSSCKYLNLRQILGWYPCYQSMSYIIQSSFWQVQSVIRTPKGSLCCLLLSTEFQSNDVFPSELSHFKTKSNLPSTRRRETSYLLQGFGCHGH